MSKEKILLLINCVMRALTQTMVNELNRFLVAKNYFSKPFCNKNKGVIFINDKLSKGLISYDVDGIKKCVKFKFSWIDPSMIEVNVICLNEGLSNDAGVTILLNDGLNEVVIEFIQANTRHNVYLIRTSDGGEIKYFQEQLSAIKPWAEIGLRLWKAFRFYNLFNKERRC